MTGNGHRPPLHLELETEDEFRTAGPISRAIARAAFAVFRWAHRGCPAYREVSRGGRDYRICLNHREAVAVEDHERKEHQHG